MGKSRNSRHKFSCRFDSPFGLTHSIIPEQYQVEFKRLPFNDEGLMQARLSAVRQNIGFKPYLCHIDTYKFNPETGEVSCSSSIPSWSVTRFYADIIRKEWLKQKGSGGRK